MNEEGLQQEARIIEEDPMTEVDVNLDISLELDEEHQERSDIRQTNDDDIYGDILSYKNSNSNILRLGFININGIPNNPEHPKNTAIFQAIQNAQIDIIAMAEINKCWYQLTEEERWKARTRSWWESSHSTIAYNLKDSDTKKFQPGGNILTSINKAAHRIIGSGKDKTGLGRWCWSLFRGKHNVTLRVISAYRPCKPSTSGPNTVYSQHQRYLTSRKDERCPRDAILEDLGDKIIEWKEKGDQIILMMDCNEDVRSNRFNSWIIGIGLKNAILHKHGRAAPPTFHKGSAPIDGIFTSHSITTLDGGFRPFGEFPSDHRALYIDISYINAFGYNMNKIVRPKARRLKCNDPRVRDRWKKIYSEYIIGNELHIKQFGIEMKAQENLTNELKSKYEEVLKLRKEGMDRADKKCRKLCMGGVPFSPEFQIHHSTIELWRAVMTKKRGGRYSSSKLKRLEARTNIHNSMQTSQREVEEKLKRAYKDYWTFKKDAKKARSTWLEGLANAIAIDKEQDKDNIYKQLIQRERQRESARKIKATLGKINSGGVTKVEIQLTNGTITEMTTKVGIENACMNENESKFRQTQNTPCMVEPMRSELGYDSNTKAGLEILQGIYTPPPGVDNYTKELLIQLKKAELIYPAPSATLTKKIFQEGWKVMKETTSAGSITGLHFGHLKACASDQFLSEFESSISHIPYSTGYTPKSWQYGVNVMLKKKAQVDLVTSLRTIVLTEADFNFNNKILGRQTLAHAEKNGLIAKEQYGSRKGKRAIEHAIHKRLTYDILRQFRYPGALCSNDAKSCYDRIIHSVATLAYRRLGIESTPVDCMFKSIQNMKHHIRTTYGDSSFTMSSEGTLIPFQGALQGNGASPATWVVISTPLLNMLRQAGNGGFFVEPISKKIHHSVGYAFVDDTDLIQLDLRDSSITVEEIMLQMQNGINRWEGGLKATGGAIVPGKSWVYPIDFKFNQKGQWEYKSIEEIDYNFTVKDHSNTTHTLRQFEADHGHETLGVILAPDGNNKDVIRELRSKSEVWKDHVQAGHIDRKEAWQAISTTIMKTIQYPLPALTLTKEECKHITAPILEAGLPKSAVCRNYPRAVLYGPKKEGGMGLWDPYDFQGIERISYLQQHLAAPTMMGELLRTSIEAAKIEIGIGRDLFGLDYQVYQALLTPCWIKDVWKYARENNITIYDYTTGNMDTSRENDLFLMEIITNEGFTRSELKRINMCRLYLQVMTLSDIVDGYGDYYTCSYNGIKDSTLPDTYIYPKQEKPDSKTIAIWKKAIRKSFPSKQGKLEYRLGKWTIKSIDDHNWLYHPPSTTLYQRHGNQWKVWTRNFIRGTIGRRPKFHYRTNGFNIPTNCCIATVKRTSNRNIVQITGWREWELISKRKQKYESLDWLSTSNEKISTDDELAICKDIANGTIKAVSDGSYKSEIEAGTAGWIMENEASTTQCTGKVKVTGPGYEQCSYRSELMGILALITHIVKLCIKYHIKEGTVHIGCDGKGAIDAIMNKYESVQTSRKHFDIISSIHKLIDLTPINWTFRHISAHQDDVKSYDELNRWEQLNVEADTIAKDHMKEMIAEEDWNKNRPNWLPLETCAVFWTDRQGRAHRICSKLSVTLKNHTGSDRIRDYWVRKGKFTPLTERSIDWESHHKSHSNLSTGHNRWMSKWLTGFCGIGIMLQIYKHQHHNKCPRCQINETNVAHILQCPAPAAQQLWNTSINELREWLIAHEGHPLLCKLVCDNMKAWHSHNPYPSEKIEDDILRQAIKDQDKIGWMSFIEGYWSINWRLKQQDHLEKIHSRKSPSLWISRAQRKIWEVAWKMWMHRNDVLHNDGTTIHSHELISLDGEIIKELMTGLHNLSDRYAPLFKVNIQTKLKETFHMKRLWLTSVWTARDNHNVSAHASRNPDASVFYNKWKRKRETELEEERRSEEGS